MYKYIHFVNSKYFQTIIGIKQPELGLNETNLFLILEKFNPLFAKVYGDIT